MRSKEERERRVSELRGRVEAGLYQADPDRVARAIVKASRKKVLGQLDVKPGC
ncbi:MAG: flagellar biosynthesis anti-sigma factor FlgM [Deltaproteobacteria bacterium]|nr:MAG: flagellar biosynthesis anti-sigma factor FlgM [Deltaproteobacteria bacterium]